MNKPKILIVDDHSMMRSGIKSLFQDINEWEIIKEATNGVEALNVYYELNPDIIILDISMPEKNGMEVAEEILASNSQVGIIMLSMYDDEEYIGKCVELGVKGFLIKSDSGEELVTAVKTVLEGKTYFSSKAQQSIFNKYTQTLVKKKSNTELIKITKREIEIVELLSDGYTSQQISAKLFISIRTVETHRSNLLKKLNVRNSIELVKRARELGAFNKEENHKD